jgi:protein MpaA
MRIQTKYLAGVVLIGLSLFIYLRHSSPVVGTRLPAESAEIKILQDASPDQTNKQRGEEIQIGKSNNNIPIKAIIRGIGKKSIIVLGGIHGDEPSSVVLAKALVLSLQRSDLSSDLKVIVVPIVNPDGLLSKTRVNSRNVDINRNFPSSSWRAGATKDRYQPGKVPASEPETQAIINLIRKYKPKLIISIHAPLGCVNWDGPAQEIAQIIAEVSGYPMKKDIGYRTPGSLGTHAGIDRAIPTITLEIRANETDAQIYQNIKALRQALSYVASR